MMNKSILILEKKTAGSRVGGSFICKASFKLDNMYMPFHNVEVKIDSGCSTSVLPLRHYGIPSRRCISLKEQDIDNDVPYVLSYGVESGGIPHPVPNTRDEKIKCPAMKFLHGIQNFNLGGMSLDIDSIHVNYDRTSNILIGLDILEKLEIHIGESRADGKYIFVACPKDNITREYIQALENHFGLTNITANN